MALNVPLGLPVDTDDREHLEARRKLLEKAASLIEEELVRKQLHCPLCGEVCDVDDGCCTCHECDYEFEESQSAEAVERDRREEDERQRELVHANCDDHRCSHHPRHGQPGDQAATCDRIDPLYDPEPGDRVSDYCRRYDPCPGCVVCRPACDATKSPTAPQGAVGQTNGGR